MKMLRKGCVLDQCSFIISLILKAANGLDDGFAGLVAARSTMASLFKFFRDMPGTSMDKPKDLVGGPEKVRLILRYASK